MSCERSDENITQDQKILPIELNLRLKEEILNSEIETIFFTSAFGKNNAAKLFFKVFNLQRPMNWTKDRDFTIDFFGKQIRCVILFSSSGQANRGIVKNKTFIEKKKLNSFLSVKTFKIDFYRSKFCNLLQK